VLAILGMIGLTSVLGYMAISVRRRPLDRSRLRQPHVPAGHDRADLLSVVVAVLHPIAWTDDESGDSRSRPHSS
jgi:hypothetical protein